MSDILSLTREEAESRAALLEVARYDIEVDLRGLFEGEVFAATSTITFKCSNPGTETFVDCTGEISAATLNGQPLDPSTASQGRLRLTDLQTDNVLAVSSTQSNTASGDGILKTVDPLDKLVYIWTTLECDAARKLWACFDQPDLKAVHRFQVTAPSTWTVTNNSAPDSIEDLPDDQGRLWTFADTPRLSTYVVVVNAGPFHELREHRGGYSLGLYCRQSLKAFLERDAEELFTLTEQGLAFFGERFGSPFAQERYDQVFVPNMGGAMENWGSVTWTDSVLYRSVPTHAQRDVRAQILLHEMAHMWFGDLVTMKWWDDLWLNEAFASWASHWAAEGATSYADAWATFLVGEKLDAYAIDQGPGTHPIRGQVPNVAQAMANFDAITYRKGASVLKQLVAYVGEDKFVEGLRLYFARHAWGNTRLADLMGAISEASGRDLDDWTTAWLDRAGTDQITLTSEGLHTDSPDGTTRHHRLDIASYQLGDQGLELVATTPVETSGEQTPVALPDADLRLVNATDLTWAVADPGPESLDQLLAHAASLPAAIDRALLVSTAVDRVRAGALAADKLIGALVAVLPDEQSPAVIEPFLAIAGEMASYWTPIEQIRDQQSRVADAAAVIAEHPAHRQVALRALAAGATSPAHFETLKSLGEDDTDLGWRIATRRAALGEHDQDLVDALLAKDPDPDAGARAITVRAARPDAAAKDEAWTEIYDKRSMPGGPMLGTMVRCFWQPGQTEILLPFTSRYLDVVPGLAGGGMLSVFGLIRGMFPSVGDQTFLDRCQMLIDAGDTDPTVRSTLLSGGHSLRQMLRARSVS